MLRAIEDYLSGQMHLGRLVGFLEMSLDASELKDESLIRGFYECWEPLEVEYACNLEMGTPINEERLHHAVEAMKAFLLRTRALVEAYDPGKF